MEEFNQSMSQLCSQIAARDLKQKDTNFIFESCFNLLRSFKELNEKWTSEIDPNSEAKQVLGLAYDIAHNHLASFRSVHKRNKKIFSNKNFVAPVVKSIGTRYELKKTMIRGRLVNIPRLLQCTLQYVPILHTVESLFSCNEFASLYFEYNGNIRANVTARDGSKSYTSFNSGSCFKNNELFQLYPDSLQLCFSADELEPNNALQSKSNRHKICAIYMTIQNMPQKYASKLNNIYLVCLCNADDLKTKQTDFNNVWQLIVNEISVLEIEGIVVNGKALRGTIVHTAFDNLGANVGLGFSGSFSSNKFCRHCVSSKSECRKYTSEFECTIRTLESYEKSLQIIDESESVDLNETDGVKFYCVLSELSYYHILENPTSDTMHDINEGCIPELLGHFFKFCFKEKFFSPEQVDNLIKCYDFGVLNHSNVPSEVSLTKRSLGQNASQSMCLFRNLPFILNKYRNHPKLKETWQCIQSLLQICEIVTSYEISEFEIQRLEKTVQFHLELYKKIFKTHLIPKQHFLLHYARTIRTVGPLRHFDMARFDAKHRIFKIFRSLTNNLKDLNMTLALKHQKKMCTNGFTYKDNIEYGVLIPFNDEETLCILRNLHEFPGNVSRTKYIHYNNYRYSKGLFIVHNQSFHEIVNIFCMNEEFNILCLPYIIKNFDIFYNSFEVEKNEVSGMFVVKLSELVYLKSHETKCIGTNSYILSDSLDLRFNLNVR